MLSTAAATPGRLSLRTVRPILIRRSFPKVERRLACPTASQAGVM